MRARRMLVLAFVAIPALAAEIKVTVKQLRAEHGGSR
jgi:hypothetical protein